MAFLPFALVVSGAASAAGPAATSAKAAATANPILVFKVTSRDETQVMLNPTGTRPPEYPRSIA